MPSITATVTMSNMKLTAMKAGLCEVHTALKGEFAIRPTRSIKCWSKLDRPAVWSAIHLGTCQMLCSPSRKKLINPTSFGPPRILKISLTDWRVNCSGPVAATSPASAPPGGVTSPARASELPGVGAPVVGMSIMRVTWCFNSGLIKASATIALAALFLAIAVSALAIVCGRISSGFSCMIVRPNSARLCRSLLVTPAILRLGIPSTTPEAMCSEYLIGLYQG